jgi:hypothetical protein
LTLLELENKATCKLGTQTLDGGNSSDGVIHYQPL